MAIDVFRQLQTASWRDVEFPVSGSEFGFAQDFAQHRYLFRDQQLVESLGRQNPTYRYSVPMREGILRGPFKNLFVATYPELLEACLDRSPGVLVDPFHGARRCKCASLREVRDVGKRDGVDVELEFVVAPEDTDVVEDLGTQIATLEGARGLAGILDDELKKVDFQQEPPPEPTLDPFSFVSSIGDQLSVAGNKVSARMHSVAFRAEKAAASIDRLRKPELARHREAALRLQAAALDLERSASVTGARPLRAITVRANMTLAALASLHGMTVEQLIKHNPILARTPLVRAGTEVRVFAGQSTANARAA